MKRYTRTIVLRTTIDECEVDIHDTTLDWFDDFYFANLAPEEVARLARESNDEVTITVRENCKCRHNNEPCAERINTRSRRILQIRSMAAKSRFNPENRGGT